MKIITKIMYLVKGMVHAGFINPWPVNKENVFEKQTEELNKLAIEGWELIAAVSAGNNDREILFLKKVE